MDGSQDDRFITSVGDGEDLESYFSFEPDDGGGSDPESTDTDPRLSAVLSLLLGEDDPGEEDLALAQRIAQMDPSEVSSLLEADEEPASQEDDPRLQAALQVLLSADTEEDLAEAQEVARRIMGMDDEAITEAMGAVSSDDIRVPGMEQAPTRKQTVDVSESIDPEALEAAHSLAVIYAGAFNTLEIAGEDVEDLAQDADEELDGSGWNLARSRSTGRWVAVRDAAEDDEPDATPIDEAGGERAPKGGIELEGRHYRGGQFIPAKVVASLPPEEREKLEQAKANAAQASQAKADARKARGSVDTHTLRNRLAQHADRHGLTDFDRRRAGAAARLLHRHHGELALHRVEELADRLEAALGRIPDDEWNAEGLRLNLGQQLARLHAVRQGLQDAGVTGAVKAPEPAKQGIDFATATDDEIDAHMKGLVGPEYGKALREMPAEVSKAYIDRKTKADRFARRSRASTKGAKTRQRSKEQEQEIRSTPYGSRMLDAQNRVESLGRRYSVGAPITDQEFDKAERELHNASLAYNLHKMYTSPDVVASRRNDELPDLNLDEGPAPTEATREMNTIPWVVRHMDDSDPVVISGAKLEDSTMKGERVLRLYGIDPGTMAGDSQTHATGGGEMGSLLVHFPAGDPEMSRRARRLVHAIAHGKAQQMTVDEMRDMITGATPSTRPEDEPGFTGTDSQGREWQDGKLVAKQEEAAPATAGGGTSTTAANAGVDSGTNSLDSGSGSGNNPPSGPSGPSGGGAMRKLSDITKEFRSLQRTANTPAVPAEQRAEAKAKIMAMRDEIASAMVPLSSPKAAEQRQQFIGTVLTRIEDAETEARQAEDRGKYDSRFRTLADGHRKRAEDLRKGLDAAAEVADTEWWEAHRPEDAESNALALAGSRPFSRRAPRKVQPPVAAPSPPAAPEPPAAPSTPPASSSSGLPRHLTGDTVSPYSGKPLWATKRFDLITKVGMDANSAHMRMRGQSANPGVYYHVVPPDYVGGDILSGKDYERASGKDLQNKFHNDFPDYKQSGEFKKVSMFDSPEAAAAYADEFLDGKGKILAINVPKKLKRNDEGYVQAPRIPKDWIKGEWSHRGEIESALASGKPVPPEVLADYPDLAEKYAK